MIHGISIRHIILNGISVQIKRLANETLAIVPIMFLLSIENFFMGLNHVWSLLEMQSFQIKIDELHEIGRASCRERV